MGISARELMQAPGFSGIAKYVYCRPGNGDWPPSFTFEFFGGQVNVEVEESEVLNPPLVGSIFQISGYVRRSSRNGSITLTATEKKFISKDDSGMTGEQVELYVKGLPIRGVGTVEAKQSSTMNRESFLSATLRWQGATHQFKKLSPEVYQRIPVKGYVRFELAMLVREERNQGGQMVVLQIPSLVWVEKEELQTGSVAGVARPSAVSSAPAAAKA